MLWGGSFDVDKKKQSIHEKEELTHAPDFWNDPKKAEETLRSIRDIKRWTDAYDKARSSYDDLTVIFEFYEAGEATEDDLDKQAHKTIAIIVFSIKFFFIYTPITIIIYFIPAECHLNPVAGIINGNFRSLWSEDFG